MLNQRIFNVFKFFIDAVKKLFVIHIKISFIHISIYFKHDKR
ncbi:hypothetical protein [Thermosipho ferrireducens]|nr:hypothetical protein [Thermosipho ferrireducens]